MFERSNVTPRFEKREPSISSLSWEAGRQSRQLITFSFFFKTFHSPKRYSHVSRQVGTATIVAFSRHQVIGRGTKGGRTNLHLVVTSANAARELHGGAISYRPTHLSLLSPLYNPQP